jgi:TRAP-type C4-dicarboxylate transport system permease small subunit
MIVERLLRYCFDLAGITLVVLMLVTVVDIAARHLGIFTVRGIIEISTMAVVMIGFLALPYSFVLGGHIVVDLATLYLPSHVNRAIDKAWTIFAGLCLVFLAILMWQATFRAYHTNDISLDLQLPLVWFWAAASVGMTLAPVACLLALRRSSKEPAVNEMPAG